MSPLSSHTQLCHHVSGESLLYLHFSIRLSTLQPSYPHIPRILFFTITPPNRHHPSRSRASAFNWHSSVKSVFELFLSINSVTQMGNKFPTADFYSNIKLNPSLTCDEDSIVTATPHRATVNLRFSSMGTLDQGATTIAIDLPGGAKLVHFDKFESLSSVSGDSGQITYLCDAKTGTGCLVRWPRKRQSHCATTDPTVSKASQDNRSASGARTEKAVIEEGDGETLSGH